MKDLDINGRIILKWILNCLKIQLEAPEYIYLAWNTQENRIINVGVL